MSGRAKKLQMQEKRERDRTRAAEEAAKEKAAAAREEKERERRAREALQSAAASSADPTAPAAATAAAASVQRPPAATAAAAPLPLLDDDDVGGIVPVRRMVRGARAQPAAAASTETKPAAAAPSSSAAGAAAVPSLAALPCAVPATSASSTNRLRTAFARESDELIEARKAESRLPLRRDPRYFSASGTSGTPSGDYYATDEIGIPVRPPWAGLTAAQVEAQEKAYFDHWLEAIYAKYGADSLNHFEHNCEVWRQLWRVCERSDVLLVVVDSRQPLLNFPPSLYHYITVTLRKPMVLVLNKIDLLPAAVVEQWVEFFHKRFPKLFIVPFTSFPAERRETLDVHVKSKAKRGKGRTLLKPFGAAELLEACRKIVTESNELQSVSESARRNFSFDPTLLSGGSQASDHNEDIYADADSYMKVPQGGEDEDDLGSSSLSRELHQLGVLKKAKAASKRDKREQLQAINRRHMEELAEEAGGAEEVDPDDEADAQEAAANSAAHAAAMGLLEDDQTAEARGHEDFVTLGIIGLPNAGKSSLINALAGKKLVSVSVTPGHTKYLQTLFLNPSTRLADCPGLVFPAVGLPRPLQVLAGSYPIAQTRDPYSAVKFLAERLPLETIYKLGAPPPPHAAPAQPHADEGKGASSATAATPAAGEWSAWSICEAVANKKGFFNRQGAPDVYRAANFILREVLNGVVSLYFTPPLQS